MNTKDMKKFVKGIIKDCDKSVKLKKRLQKFGLSEEDAKKKAFPELEQ